MSGFRHDLLLLFPILATVGLGSRAAAQAPQALLERCTAQDVEQTAKRLRQCGAEGAEACIAVLVRGTLPASEAAREAAQAALPAFLPALRAELGALVERDSTGAARDRAIAALGTAGEIIDLPLLARLVASYPHSFEDSQDGRGPARDELLELFRTSASRILARHASELRQLRALAVPLDEPFASLVIDALGDSHTREALEYLGLLVAKGDGQLARHITAIARAARSVPGPHDERLRNAVRWLVEREGQSGFREAIVCVGCLEDDDAVPTLVGLLEHPLEGVRSDALWSLSRITGARFGPAPARWRRWLEGELEWWRSDAPRLFAALDSGDRIQSSAALNEIMRHRFPRHGLAAELSRRLDALRGLSFESACQVLAQWRSAAALPALQALDPAAMSERELAAWQQCLAALGAPLEGDASAPR